MAHYVLCVVFLLCVIFYVLFCYEFVHDSVTTYLEKLWNYKCVRKVFGNAFSRVNVREITRSGKRCEATRAFLFKSIHNISQLVST